MPPGCPRAHPIRGNDARASPVDDSPDRPAGRQAPVLAWNSRASRYARRVGPPGSRPSAKVFQSIRGLDPAKGIRSAQSLSKESSEPSPGRNLRPSPQGRFVFFSRAPARPVRYSTCLFGSGKTVRREMGSRSRAALMALAASLLAGRAAAEPDGAAAGGAGDPDSRLSVWAEGIGGGF